MVLFTGINRHALNTKFPFIMTVTLKLEEVEKIWELHRKGASAQEIATILKHDRHTIQNVLDSGEPRTAGSSVSVKELETMKQSREQVKNMAPDLATALKQDPELGAHFARRGIHLLTKEEWSYISRVDDLDVPPGASRGEKLDMITKVIRFITNEWGGGGNGVSADDLQSLTQGTMDLWAEMAKRGIVTEQIDAFLGTLIYLEQAGLDEQGYNSLGAFIVSCREHGVDLAAFLRKYNMSEVSRTLADYTAFLKSKEKLEHSVEELRKEEQRLISVNGKHRTLQKLNDDIWSLSSEVESLCSERDTLKAEVDRLHTIVKGTLTVGYLLSQVKEKEEELNRLNSQITSKEINLRELEARISRLKPRYEYMRSGAFANDLAVDMFARTFRTGSQAQQGIPETIRKNQDMRDKSQRHAGQEKSIPVIRSAAATHKPLRVRMADGDFQPQ